MDTWTPSPYLAITLCSCLSWAFVASLYMWKGSATSRNEPAMIKKRTISVAVVCFTAFGVLYALTGDDLVTFLARVGFRSEGIFAAFLPLLHTVILFAGPLALLLYEGEFLSTFNVFGRGHRNLLINVRDYLVAPLFEELVFRSFMLNVLCSAFCSREVDSEDSQPADCFAQCPFGVLFGAPLFFGIAHLHHAYERVRQGESVGRALAACCFQLAYTTVFGTYVSFVFVRTRHLLSIVLVHSFCNLMGFPDVQAAFYLPTKQRNVTLTFFVLGLIFWIFTFNLFLDYSLFHELSTSA